MKLTIPNTLRLGRVIDVLRQVRWRDPLVQVWGLAGGLLVVGIATHYVRSGGGSEKKNRETATMILREESSWGSDWRPGVPFSAIDPLEDSVSPEGSEPDLRGIASVAAAQKGWQHLQPPIRKEIATRTGAVRAISVGWSGTPGGDLAALEWYHASVLGNTGGMPGDFIIGNGRRSVDGRIEPTHRWLSGTSQDSAEILICLTGEQQSTTPAQSEALGELITALEAGNGRTTLSGHRPAERGQLAASD